jgi:hypothetical protein
MDVVHEHHPEILEPLVAPKRVIEFLLYENKYHFGKICILSKSKDLS